ncbi:MAG: hypothetical protein QOH93_2235 [Chloroflexia bacterium]|nr:hypothetical protein [Chloroflexia bacterium]
MNDSQGGLQGGSGGEGGSGGGSSRPDVLDNISETQMEELERQFEEGDRSAWLSLTNSYGWTPMQSEQVWGWFGQRLRGGLFGGGS